MHHPWNLKRWCGKWQWKCRSCFSSFSSCLHGNQTLAHSTWVKSMTTSAPQPQRVANCWILSNGNTLSRMLASSHRSCCKDITSHAGKPTEFVPSTLTYLCMEVKKGKHACALGKKAWDDELLTLFVASKFYRSLYHIPWPNHAWRSRRAKGVWYGKRGCHDELHNCLEWCTHLSMLCEEVKRCQHLFFPLY